MNLMYALSRPARCGDRERVMQLLAEAGEPANSPAGAWALYQAAWCGQLDLVEALWAAGARAEPVAAMPYTTALTIAVAHDRRIVDPRPSWKWILAAKEAPGRR